MNDFRNPEARISWGWRNAPLVHKNALYCPAAILTAERSVLLLGNQVFCRLSHLLLSSKSSCHCRLHRITSHTHKFSSCKTILGFLTQQRPFSIRRLHTFGKTLCWPKERKWLRPNSSPCPDQAHIPGAGMALGTIVRLSTVVELCTSSHPSHPAVALSTYTGIEVFTSGSSLLGSIPRLKNTTQGDINLISPATYYCVMLYQLLQISVSSFVKLGY